MNEVELCIPIPDCDGCSDYSFGAFACGGCDGSSWMPQDELKEYHSDGKFYYFQEVTLTRFNCTLAEVEP